MAQPPPKKRMTPPTAALQPHLARIRVPQPPHTRVHKDEAVFTFTTPESPGGLFLCLNTFLSFSRPHAAAHHAATGNAVFLHIVRTPRPGQDDPAAAAAAAAAQPVSKLAIGVPGGFAGAPAPVEYDEEQSLVVLPSETVIPLPANDLPLIVSECLAGVAASDSVTQQDAVAAWSADEDIKDSKLAADLVQLDNGVKIPPGPHKCSRCDLTENLWLNLTDGCILCGRRQFDGTGGNSHALEHYEETKYPLCVKLGTITPDGHADVFSYAEGDMVRDPLLAKHLAHFGINISSLEKTERTMAELEIALNEKHEWKLISEEGKNLVPLSGPGYTGLINLGNTCYMASVLQACFTLPEFVARYAQRAEALFQQFNTAAGDDPTNSLEIQLAKVGAALAAGDHAEGVRPRAFKALIGRGHPEFSTGRQQDAFEFFQYFLDQIHRAEHRAAAADPAADPSLAFRFKMADKTRCDASGKVRIRAVPDNVLSLGIPIDKASNLDDVTAYQAAKAANPKADLAPVLPRVSLQDCLEAFAASTTIPDFLSSATGQRGSATRSSRFVSMPKYLLIQLRRFYTGDDWTPKKLEVLVDMPDRLDIEWLRGSDQLAAGEEPLPDDAPADDAAAAAPTVDESIVQQLVPMGFPEPACRRAAHFTQNAGAEAAMNWLLEHSGDADFCDPLPAPGGGGGGGGGAGGGADPEKVAQLQAMGFPESFCEAALKATSNDPDRAVEWLFSHPDGPPADDGAAAGGDGAAGSGDDAVSPDGKGVYRHAGFISHMGSSTFVGHYVVHLKKDGKWALFNDDKVAQSIEPPVSHGYIHLYVRE